MPLSRYLEEDGWYSLSCAGDERSVFEFGARSKTAKYPYIGSSAASIVRARWFEPILSAKSAGPNVARDEIGPV
jgi:hypothetical protein